MIDLLNLLPSELATSIVAEWLEIGNLVRLDSSYTNQAGRAGYLSFLPSSDRAYEVPAKAYDREETSDVVKWIMMRGVKVSNVKFTRAVDMLTFKSFMDTMGDKLIAVHFVDIASEILMEQMACEVVARSRHLTELSLFECPMTSAMWPIFGRFPDLAKVSLCSNRPLSLPPTDLDLGQCPKLRCVSLAGLGIGSHESLALVERAPRGNILLLSMVGAIHLSDEAIVRIARHCPNLRALGLAHMTRTSNAVVTLIAELCPDIEHLDLSYNHLNDAALIPVIEQLRLKSLCVDDNILLTDATLDAVQSHQTDTLHTLFISNIPDFSSWRIMSTVEDLLHLHTLSVGGDEDEEELLTEEFVLSLVNVDTLLLFGEEIRSRNLSHIARHCARLKHLGVITTRSIKKGLLEVVQKCTALEALHVQKMDARSLVQWGKLNPALTVRKVEGDYHYFDILSVDV